MRVYPLKGPPKPETKLEPQRFQLATPPPGPPGLKGPLQALNIGGEVPLQDLEFPLPEFRIPIRKEERTIAQKDIDNAKDNMRYFGLHLVWFATRRDSV